jgi:hypothetical protein
MKVLHDWDDPYLNWKWAAFLGLRYLIFAFLSFFGIRPKFLGKIKDELRNYAETLAKLDTLCGIEPIFGIRDVVQKEYTDIFESLSNYDKADIRTHKHIGEDYKDPERERKWYPPLSQPKHTWHYDKDYVSGETPLLNKGELPVWHVDRSYLLENYIDFLYRVKIDGLKIYKDDLKQTKLGYHNK